MINSLPVGETESLQAANPLFKYVRAGVPTGGILKRLARLLDALAYPERYVARFMKLLGSGLRARASS